MQQIFLIYFCICRQIINLFYEFVHSLLREAPATIIVTIIYNIFQSVQTTPEPCPLREYLITRHGAYPYV